MLIITENLLNDSKMENVRIFENCIDDNQAAMLDIKGIFNDNEWLAIGLAFSNVSIESEQLYNNELLCKRLKESKAAKNLCYEIDELCFKISKLTRLQTATILRRIKAYYQNPKAQTAISWANF